MCQQPGARARGDDGENDRRPLIPDGAGRSIPHAMSVPRQPAPKPRASQHSLHGTKPAVSGEYRIIAEGPRRSSATMTAVRPEIRRVSSTSLPAVRVQPAPVTGATATPSGPRRYASVQMEAITPPRSAGRELDDFDFDFDIDADGALELDSRPSAHLMRAETSRLPTSGEAPAARSSGSLAAGTPPRRSSSTTMSAVEPPRRSSTTMAAVDTHDALVAFSGFGMPPVSVFGAPAYAARVILRRRTLRRELALARLRHSQDVGIYEASLRTADDVAVRNGILVTVVFFTMMTLLAWTALRLFSGSLAVPW